MPNEKQWWEKYIDEADYCECHDMCENCYGSCSCWPDDHVTRENAEKLVAEAERRKAKEIREEIEKTKNTAGLHVADDGAFDLILSLPCLKDE